ncbi:diaminopimelate decarboxylase [Desulfonispora thiosulfatigenes DSM 11270]|uniref:Diaminopimelate decarboxylase n=1 Tax=Desulfonispora thiosulfatigenes DSM 11270 TaxID=656914 RepID=A0A1W1VF53_DESTI|nr:hypothetical protein [Desulfonispora thiosulfatigenes]SMB91840.1 diaminopimelate decarboxylase [Desulfonispora thiosulfatigenes DSM 11270]
MENIYNIIDSLMKQYDKPFYFYDESVIAKNIKILKEKFLRFEFLYSIKANPYTPIVDFIVSEGLGADAASSEEVILAYNTGLTSEKILYSTPGKTRNDIEKTYDKSIIIADSYNELVLINEVAKDKDIQIKVGIRINPDFDIDSGVGVSSKFGVDEDTLVKQKSFLDSLKNLKIIGIHVHLRSQIIDYRILYRYYEKVFLLSLFCKEVMKWELDFINFGGGLGIVYSSLNDSPLDLELLSEKCEVLFQRFKDKIKVRLILETGRFVVCEAGQYITQIVDIKESRGTKYLIVKNSLNGFFRPSIAEFLAAYTPKEKNYRAVNHYSRRKMLLILR